MYLCVNKSLKTAGISAPTLHILTVPFITALEQLREVRGFTQRGRKNIEWKAAIIIYILNHSIQAILDESWFHNFSS
jgi:hypothetical protein